jgi:hypothetical protein
MCVVPEADPGGPSVGSTSFWQTSGFFFTGWVPGTRPKK